VNLVKFVDATNPALDLWVNPEQVAALCVGDPPETTRVYMCFQRDPLWVLARITVVVSTLMTATVKEPL
jgi:hypothetical protein